MSFFLSLIGFKGLVALVGLMVFSLCYKYSISMFEWIEYQTYGTRTYILDKFEFLHIEFASDKLTLWLLACSVGLGSVIFLIFGALGFWLAGIIIAIIFTFLGFKVPKKIVDYLVERRIKAYTGQMVDALQLLSNGIRAGLSVPQACGMIVDEMPPPISQEFGIILQQNRIGVPLEECFENLAKRIPTEDNDMFVSSVNILRETGGNLAETFDTIVDVIRERVRLQQKIDTYVAQGMFQGMVIGAMPYGLGILYYLQDPDSMTPLFTTGVGILFLIVAVALDLVGFYVIMKIVNIKI
jgi:tight adherence protein B